jgi:formylglycine-generating enzyme required for sulfatase activity
VTDVPLYDLLTTLSDARFAEVVERTGWSNYVTAKAPRMQQAAELLARARETEADAARLHALLAPDRSTWPDTALARWRAWAAWSLGSVPLIGLQSRVRQPVDLERSFVPLRLSTHLFGPLHDRLELPDLPERMWLADALAFTESSQPRSLQGIVLIGLPGCGKTTLLKHAWCVAAHKGPAALGLRDPTLTPVMLRVARCDPDLPPHELLRKALHIELTESGHAGAASALLDGRPLLWLLDGLDEAGSPERRQRLTGQLAAAMAQEPTHRFVLTCRSAAWRSVEGMLSGRLHAWNVQPLDPEDVGPFVRRWHEAVLPVLAPAGTPAGRLQAEATRGATGLTDRLSRPEWLGDRRRESMTHNPLLLSILCLVHHTTRALPDKRSELYERALRIMFEDALQTDIWGQATEHKRLPALPLREGLQVLAAVAWEAHGIAADGDVREFTTEQATGWIDSALLRVRWPEASVPSALDLLRRAESACGVLVATDPDHRWQFAHLTFQEYLAALHAGEIADGGAELAKRAGEDRWEEPIRLAMSLPRVPAELFRAVLARTDAPWDKPRFQIMLADCAKDSDPTPFADALQRTTLALQRPPCWQLVPRPLRLALGVRDLDAEVLRALRVLGLFQGRKLPSAVEAAAQRFLDAERRDLRQAARALLQLPGEVLEPKPGDVWVGPLGMAFVWVPPGEYWMGATKERGQNHDPEAHAGEGPVRRVRITRGYWLGMHPVTNAQYRQFVLATGHRASSSWGMDGFDAEEQPVTGVDWQDARSFNAWLSAQLEAGLTAALPTEAEWERAARGDDGRRYPWGDQAPTPERAVFGGAPLAPVGGRPEGVSPYGAHDMAGNVWEWCQDVGARYPTVSGVDIDPCQGVTSPDAASRVVRGGSWGSNARGLRAAGRVWNLPGGRRLYLGFRVCLRREPGR